MIRYSRNCVRTIMNLVFDSTQVNDLLYHTNISHEVPLCFVWLKFSSFGWDIDMKRIRSDKTLSLGMLKAPQVNIQGRSKQLSLGMPRKASPLSSSTLSVTLLGAIFLFVTWYEFCLESNFLLLGFLLLFRIMFCIFYFSKNVKYSLYHGYFASPYVVVWKQKVFYHFLNSSGKSERDKILKLLRSMLL